MGLKSLGLSTRSTATHLVNQAVPTCYTSWYSGKLSFPSLRGR